MAELIATSKGKKAFVNIVYVRAPGSQFSEDKTQIYGREIDRIKVVHGGRIKPQDLVDHAKRKSNPLHDFFEWDDKIAGPKFRKIQARHLLSHIDIKVIENEDWPPVIRNRWIRPIRDKVQAYRDVETVLDVPDHGLIFLEELERAILYWQEKCKLYTDLYNALSPAVFAVQRAIKRRKKQISKLPVLKLPKRKRPGNQPSATI